ncbi:MAG: ribbon-helix-helix protein, CopG family [Acidimicrobiaceae bacterium]|nr:ribbon-helix-helix protein, CopG family [Ilumatobacter sp.]MCB9382577.1 ribbon-helix-helix protein, CopG family [Acidimicrobiaceae bacterium]MCO5329066.1 ribbon-helix-helix domain-containing protein [Ilumatobacteraceae bacterium]
MSTQIAVRLPDEIVESVDAVVRSGRARSRADLVARALQRELRRIRAEADLRIIAASAAEHDPDDLDGLAKFALRRSVTPD